MKIAIMVALLGFATAAEASRPSTYRMTCAQAAGMVQHYGAIVMNYGYSEHAGDLYNRFVAHGGYCLWGETTIPAWVPTLDNAQCFIGYVCSDSGTR